MKTVRTNTSSGITNPFFNNQIIPSGDAYQKGFLPVSKLVAELKKDPTFRGLTSADIRKVLEPAGIYSTGKLNQPTLFYSIQEAVKMHSKIREVIEERKANAKNSRAISIPGVSVRWLEWSGDRYNIERHEVIVDNVDLLYKGKVMITIQLPQGLEINKRKTTKGLRINGQPAQTFLEAWEQAADPDRQSAQTSNI